MTAIASRAMICSTGSTPFDFASSISSCLIWREALAISTVPLMSAAIPVPDPPPVTDIRTSGLSAWYFSAQASARLTIVSEPLFSIYDAEEFDVVSEDGLTEQEVKKRLERIKIKNMRFIELNYSR